jgi:hypothetical protein
MIIMIRRSYLLLCLLLACSVVAAQERTRTPDDPMRSQRKKSIAGGGNAPCPRDGPSHLDLAKALANPATTMAILAKLYMQYGAELAALHAKMLPWCEKTQSCKF